MQPLHSLPIHRWRAGGIEVHVSHTRCLAGSSSSALIRPSMHAFLAGNADGLGHLREKELAAAAQVFKVNKYT